VGAGVLGICKGDSAGDALDGAVGRGEMRIGYRNTLSARCSVLFLLCQVTVKRSGAPAQHLHAHPET
jgi:hypothetical protein